jgi:hypothetical protein
VRSTRLACKGAVSAWRRFSTSLVALEDSRLLATFTSSSTAGGDGASGPCLAVEEAGSPTTSSTIEFHLGRAPAAIAFCPVAVTQAWSCWETFLPIFWALSRQRARPRALRSLVPWGDNLDERVLLDAGAAGSRAREMAATAVESAKENLKPPDLAKFEPLAADIVTHGFGTPPPKSLDTAMEKAVERALRAGGVPDVGKSQVALVPPLPGFQNFDDNLGGIYYTDLVIRPHSANPTNYAVQVYVPSTSPKTGLFAYAGQTSPTVFVATPTPAAPVDANRILAAMTTYFQAPLTFGPVNATDVGETIVQKLTAAGFPDTAYDIMVNFAGEIEIGNGGNALTTVFAAEPDFQTSPVYYVQMYLDSNGTYEVNVSTSSLGPIPVSNPEFYPYPGITSPFFLVSP